ncbi:hypothetical protein EK0264_07180 [Epidermidibacterium keratini]|uniref:Uncharacterized protein n=1 Tax=Epidermidibacterium keratini TaxID=1891644 RepID=A0A7L4YLS1_9ACTN|nr:hypothetical protein [Epidermidibacterium keratini]QHC00080.1 hypothetical protein EK0264_07180 [Epidermidibacterium keratini]
MSWSVTTTRVAADRDIAMVVAGDVTGATSPQHRRWVRCWAVMETKRLIEELLSRIGSGDADGAASLFANAIDFAIPHHPDVLVDT